MEGAGLRAADLFRGEALSAMGATLLPEAPLREVVVCISLKTEHKIRAC